MPLNPLIFTPCTLALYGVTGGGKSTSLALLAKALHETTGKKTRWNMIDGGEIPAEGEALVNKGIIEKIDCRAIPHPFLTGQRLAQGYMPVMKGYNAKTDVSTGGFVPGDFKGIGLAVFDSGTELANKMFLDLSDKSAEGLNIGGEGAWNFKDGIQEKDKDGKAMNLDLADGWGNLQIGASNKAHYNVVQTRMKNFIDRLGQLSARHGIMVACTFGEDRGEQDTTKVALITPKTIGSAQGPYLPGWFKFCFRIASVGQAPGVESKRVLWTDRHKDGGVEALANRRFPVLDTETRKKYPICIDPANLVKALEAYVDVTK